MMTALKRYSNVKTNATKKESLKNDFLELGLNFFQKKNELKIAKRKKQTRKVSQDYSQQTAFEKCKLFQPRIESKEKDDGSIHDEEDDE